MWKTVLAALLAGLVVWGVSALSLGAQEETAVVRSFSSFAAVPAFDSPAAAGDYLAAARYPDPRVLDQRRFSLETTGKLRSLAHGTTAVVLGTETREVLGPVHAPPVAVGLHHLRLDDGAEVWVESIYVF